MDDVALDQDSIADLTWTQGTDSWPISTYLYMITPRSTSVNCLPPTSIVEMVYWIFTSSSAASVNPINYGTFPRLLISGPRPQSLQL